MPFIVDYWIRVESLSEDLVAALRQCGGESEHQIEAFYSLGKTNTSSRKKGYQQYYDDASAALVREKEALLIANHGYEF